MRYHGPVDWAPFRVVSPPARPDGARGLGTEHGIGDRLRVAAFAELQAFRAFDWAAERFGEAPADLRAAWRRMALEEKLHLDLLLARMAELGVEPAERSVSDGLWLRLCSSASVPEFVSRMREAEARGKAAEDSFRAALAERDPVTAAIFGRIADDEAEHLALADRLADGSQAV
jgi:uncharacterized ferritin-like protein (DUF455 family)